MKEQEVQKLAQEMRQSLGCPVFAKDKLDAFELGFMTALRYLSDKVELIKEPEKPLTEKKK